MPASRGLALISETEATPHVQPLADTFDNEYVVASCNGVRMNDEVFNVTPNTHFTPGQVRTILEALEMTIEADGFEIANAITFDNKEDERDALRLVTLASLAVTNARNVLIEVGYCQGVTS